VPVPVPAPVSRILAPRRWTDAQQSVFDSPHHLTVWWGGNGIGKSLALAEHVRRAICGELPWQRNRPGPRTVVLAGNTWAQVGVTQSYLFEGDVAGWFREGVRYESGGLKGQRLSVYEVVGGPGKGGELRCGTFRAPNLAGPRAEVVDTDEPLPPDVHDELFPRLLGRDGRMLQTFTPTLGTSHKLDYLWKLVDDPAIPWAGEIQTELTLRNVTPRGGLVEVPWMSQAEIDRLAVGVSAIQVDMRMGRSRYPRSDTAYFSCWGPHLVSEERPPAGTSVAVGIDHGSKPGAQRAVLIAMGGHSLMAKCWVLDEYKGDGRTESEEDARGILAMLERQGLRLEDVDRWIGDRAHGGYRGGQGRKSNERLKAAIAKALGHDISVPGWSEKLPRPLARMWMPKKKDRSHLEGMEVLFQLMVSGRLVIAPRCTELVTDIREWAGSSRDPHKDGLDAWRYGVEAMLPGERR